MEVSYETLRRWVNPSEVGAGARDGAPTDTVRELRERKHKNPSLRKSSKSSRRQQVSSCGRATRDTIELCVHRRERPLMTGPIGRATYTRNQAGHDLARVRANGSPRIRAGRLPAQRQRPAVCDLLDQYCPAACFAPWPPAPTTAAKTAAPNRHTHRRNRRPGSTRAERCLN